MASRPLNQCGPCGKDFAGLRGFDRHRVGKHAYTFAEGTRMDPPREDGRRCLSAGELLEIGYELDRFGRWTDHSRGSKPRGARQEATIAAR